MPSANVKCSSCSEVVDASSSFCPQCGAQLVTPARTNSSRSVPSTRRPNRSLKTAFGVICLFIATGVFIAAINHSSDGASAAVQNTVEPLSSTVPLSSTPRIGDVVQVGYWKYQILSSEWRDYLPDGFGNGERADAHFLILELEVTNTDKSQSTLPPVKLRNSAGAEFSQSGASAFLPEAFGPLKELNPGVSSTGVVIFDVPEGTYQAEFQGGFESSESQLVDLTDYPTKSLSKPSDAPSPPPTATTPGAQVAPAQVAPAQVAPAQVAPAQVAPAQVHVEEPTEPTSTLQPKGGGNYPTNPTAASTDKPAPNGEAPQSVPQK
jgi:hypothetical protein